jgi:hypothetical protein
MDLTVPSWAAAPSADPALLAFVKCHLSSFARWDLLRVLAPASGRWVDQRTVEQSLHKPAATLAPVLDELVAEGILEERVDAGLVSYRLSPEDPSTRVIERLIATAAHDQALRQLVVARILNGSR